MKATQDIYRARREQPFGDPEFLESLGHVTISFALLDGALTALLDWVDERPLKVIARDEYSRKVERFIELALADFSPSAAPAIEAKWLQDLKAKLNSVARQRNSLMHDFWTIEVSTERFVLRGLRGTNPPEKYPTPKKMRRLSDQVYAVRNDLASLMNKWMALRRGRSVSPTQAPATT